MRPPNTYRTMDVLRSLAGGGEKRSGGDNLGPYIFLSFGDCPHFLPQNKSSVERGRIGGKWRGKKVHCPESPLLTFWVMESHQFLFFPAVLLLHTVPYLSEKYQKLIITFWLQACKGKIFLPFSRKKREAITAAKWPGSRQTKGRTRTRFILSLR